MRRLLLPLRHKTIIKLEIGVGGDARPREKELKYIEGGGTDIETHLFLPSHLTFISPDRRTSQPPTLYTVLYILYIHKAIAITFSREAMLPLRPGVPPCLRHGAPRCQFSARCSFVCSAFQKSLRSIALTIVNTNRLCPFAFNCMSPEMLEERWR